MQAIHQIVKRKDIRVISVPEELGDTVEIIVLPVTGKATGDSAHELMRCQEENGFSQTVLASSVEDVWNEL